MVHTFESLGVKIAVDVNSGAVHVLDAPAYDLLSLLDSPMGETCPDNLAARLPYERAVVDGAWAELRGLQEQGLLFTDDDYVDPEAAAALQQQAPVKALCLHVSHDCNLRCQYCFASTGDFGTGRKTMDVDTAKAAIEMTSSMDQMERDIENRCLQLLLRQQPVARDLRAISAAMKMVTDLQRIGDQCANIAEISLLLSKQGNVKVPQDIGVMSCKAGLMLRQAIGAYTGRDVETAHAVVNLDDEVDELFRQIKGELIEEVAENKDEADSSIDFIIIAKYLERVADHAVNIAQWAIFCVTGEL